MAYNSIDCRFIKWTQETTCTHGHKAELQRVLEACTKAIGTAERYREDVRYLRVWIQYVSASPNRHNPATGRLARLLCAHILCGRAAGGLPARPQ